MNILNNQKKSSPTIWANLRVLRRHPQFRPLRTAFISWIIFALVVSTTGIYSFIDAKKTQASDNFSIKTGYYYGNGTSLAVTGVGFTPEVVIIKAETAAGSMIWKSSAMPSSVTAYLGVATADNTENEITLNSDGFTVSAALEVNTVNTRYIYIAYAGSDCTSGGVMCVGSYTGDGVATKVITTGFQPDLVISKRATAVAGTFRTSSMSTNHAGIFSATANDTTGVYFTTLNSDGYTVGLTNNANASTYYYLAFKNLANKLHVGQFTGDAVDSKNITGVGFEPDFVFVKQNSAIVPAFNTTEMWGDLSAVSTAAVSAVNHIQSLDADGFQVGSSTSVNALGVVSNYFAFGGSDDPTPSGSFTMQRGSYVGTGVTQAIDTSFAPDLIFIKGNTTEYGVWSTRADTNTTHYFSLSAVGFSGGIVSMGTTDFTVGTSTTVNTNGITYEYIAFGNATTPQRPNGAADLVIGNYSGNGLSPRSIDHLGVAPNMVTIKRPVGVAALSVWSSSAMAANTSSLFSATANTVDGTIVRTLDSGGFTVGTGATVNTVNIAYSFFAFKEGSAFDVGAYAGNNTVDTEITGTGFQPDFLWTKRNTAVAAVHKSSSSTIAANGSQHFMNLSNDTNDIKTFTADGFTLGNSAEVNSTSGNYTYAAWKSSTSTSPPDTPTNTTPADSSVAQDTNTVLVSSTYSDGESNAHLDTQWQVDDDSDFSTPVWTRTASTAEETTTITSGNGTFANELLGSTELTHSTTYYFRVRYSDGVWSSWSTATSYTTSVIIAPSNTTPVDQGEVTSLTPTLTASAFSDGDGGHTAVSAQWQISTSDSFSSPLYDSGTVAYGSSFAVPSATLSDRSVYYWHVRYKDSGGQWSQYSTATRFLVAESEVVVAPVFGGTVVDQGDSVQIDAQAKLADGSVINDATVTISIFNPSGTKIVDEATMTYLTDSNGVYRYAYTIPTTSGSYLYEVTAVSGGVTGYGAANFEVRTIAADVGDAVSTINAEQIAQDAERAAQAAERAAQEAARILAEASQLKVEDIQTKVTNIQSNMDVLIGAMIVTQSSVSDLSATTTSFITALTNATNDFYKNAVLTFTSGALDGQSRRISGYNGSTKQITVDPALTSTPSNGDAFTIISQNVRVEEQVADHEVAEAAFRADTTARLTSIEGKIDTITSSLNTLDTNLDSVLTDIGLIRDSQEKDYKVTLSDVSEIQAGHTYRAKLTVLDFESNPIDATTTPEITIYDATRIEVQASTPMTRLSAGVYEYTSTVDPDGTAGLWESLVSVDVGGTGNIIRNDYWQVTGAPAQVLITAMSDTTVPTVAANVTITNEGNSAYEYQYEWCVVATQDNQCGGVDDTYYGSAAKLIASGQDFNTTLSATVPTIGSYYFKVVVYYGAEASGASRSFTATTQTEDPVDSSGGSGAGAGSANLVFSGDTYTEIVKVRNQLELNSQKLIKTLQILGEVSPVVHELLRVDNQNTDNLLKLQNKLADVRAVVATTRRVVQQQSVEPVVETYMKFNSVEIHFLISNPDSEKQTIKFKAFLPEEAKPEYIMDKDGLKVDYDTNAGAYYVSGDIVLGPNETTLRKVEMKDIWVFSPEEINLMKDQSSRLLPVLSKTQFEAQGVILKNQIDTTIAGVIKKQDASYSSPQDHIVAYRENKIAIEQVKSSLSKMEDLVVQSGANKG
ncbi:MAG: hypothetical protein KBB70_01070, partial [Candidatus Pacebacteria bacterium]|nr:hypothetical protein [Candidatus Paceibacterota bacterium]